MNLIGQKLSKELIPFMSATARHSSDGTVRIDEVVCRTEEDAAKVDAWAAKEGYPVKARVATPQEVARFDELQDMA